MKGPKRGGSASSQRSTGMKKATFADLCKGQIRSEEDVRHVQSSASGLLIGKETLSVEGVTRMINASLGIDFPQCLGPGRLAGGA